MKKRLEAELISIAHRILKLKNKSEVDQLYKETQKLYETLAVLKFYQDNYETVKSDVASADLEEKLVQHIENETKPEAVVAVTETVSEPVEPADTETEEEVIAEQTIEETGEIPSVEDESFEDNDVNEAEDHEDHEEEIAEAEEPVFKPVFELGHEEEEDEKEEEEVPAAVKAEAKQVTFDTLLGENYSDPVFVKPDEVSLFSLPKTESSEPKSVTLNDALSKSVAVGLNDRIGFVKHLFGDSNEDFNRVLSQLNTFDNFEEAKDFIEDMVKPDYNNWEGQGDYEERFMEIVAKKFL